MDSILSYSQLRTVVLKIEYFLYPKNDIVNGLYLQLDILENNYGMTKKGCDYNHDDGNPFKIIDESKFSLFMLKYPELIMRIS
jgi:hypothetical protein